MCINIVMLDMLHYITSILCKKCSSSMLFVNNLYIGRHFYFIGNKFLHKIMKSLLQKTN